MFERLKDWARLLTLGVQESAAFWSSPEGMREIALTLLRGSRLVAMLGEIAMRTARLDGWVLLSTAESLIKREAPSELETLRKRPDCSTLEGVLLASGMFDVTDEPTPGGGTRTIYRINERYELQIPSEQPAVVFDEGGPRLS